MRPTTAPLHSAVSLQVCHTLLPTLVHRKPLCRRIIALPSWQTLAAAFARRDVALTTHMSQKFQRALSRCLCLAASGFGDEGAAQQYASQLLLQTVNEVMGLAGQPQQQLAAAAQRADIQLQVYPLLSLHLYCCLLALVCLVSY